MPINLVQDLIDWKNSALQRVRTIVPGKVESSTDGIRERTADFTCGVADLEAGEEAPPDVTPDAPVMNFAGGGFYCLLPTSPDDEMLGLCSDRSLAEWRLTRNVGEADKINGKRSKVLSDIMLTQFMITAPSGAPATWDHLVVGGPMGVGLEVFGDGRVLLTKSGGVVATIDMSTTGSVTIEVQPGQSVSIGGPGAVALAKAQQLQIDLIAACVAAIGAITGPDGGLKAFQAFQAALIGLASSIGTIKAKGE